MAEFSEVMRHVKRMCEAQEDCDECPVCNALDCVCVIADLIELDLEKMENIVMQWSAENPEPKYPTWQEWHESEFPKSARPICPLNFMGSEVCNEWQDCSDCRERRIPANIAKKLGVKPIEGRK